jgi:LysR family glycine cleavage system transcriptional activator
MEERSPRLPSLNALRAFEVTARRLNFRLAAEELGVTQGAVAQHVRGLEADLGVKLFERLPRSLSPTNQGRAYSVHIRRAFELIAEATAAVRPEPLRLTISVTPTFASKWLIPRLPEFTEAHPDVELRILATESLSNFQSDGVDIAVRQGRPPFGPGLIADLLFEQEVVAVCSPTLLTDPPRPLKSEEIERFVLLNDTHDLWPEFIERVLGLRPSAKSRKVRFSQTSLAIDAAITGQGLAVASNFLVEHDVKAGRLVRAFDVVMRGTLDSYVVAPRKPQHPAPTALVRSWLLQHRD